MTTAIISDLHLGSKACEAKLIESFLSEAAFDHLILNGDVIENMDFRKWPTRHWRILKLLTDIKPTLVLGNHDGHPLFLPRLLNVPAYTNYTLETPAGNWLVTHGHLYDPTIQRPVITDAADWVYRATQKLSKRGARWLKKKTKSLGGIVEAIRNGVVAEAKKVGAIGVVAGHTHYADDVVVGGTRYINSGSWTDKPGTWVNVTGVTATLEAYE